MKLYMDTFYDGMKRNDTKEFKDVQTKYCDDVSGYSPILQID